MVKSLRTFLFLVLSLSLLSGCAIFKKDEPKTSKRKGPPAHAPAHGYRAKHHSYYYYPDIAVYFDRDKKVYFWFEGGEWRMGARVPRRFDVSSARRVRVSLDTSRPYTQHASVKADHPPKAKVVAKKKTHKKSHKKKKR